jgi:hypothetical protein
VAGGALALTGLLLVPAVGFLASIGIGALALGAAICAPLAEAPPRTESPLLP